MGSLRMARRSLQGEGTPLLPERLDTREGSAADTAETLPLHGGQHEEGLDAETTFDSGSQAEGAEEEDAEHDECVDIVVDHEESNNYDDVPQDENDDIDVNPEESKEPAAAKVAPGSTKCSKKKTSPSQAKNDATQADDEAEEIASGDEGPEGNTSKGTHKDPTILLSAQRTVRQSVRASLNGDGDGEEDAEDRDKELKEDMEDDSKPKGKGRGRGRGRGLKRPAAAVKTDDGDQEPPKSKKPVLEAEPSAEECEGDIPATQPDTEEPEEVDVPAVVEETPKKPGKSKASPRTASKTKNPKVKAAKVRKSPMKAPKKGKTGSPKAKAKTAAAPKKKPSKRELEESVLHSWMPGQWLVIKGDAPG
eukprot:s13_g29.t1